MGVKVSGKGQAVVLLHSSLSSSSQWLALTKRLNPNFQCINIDLLGYGAAPEVNDPEKYNLDTEAKRVLAIVESYIGDAQFHVVGHSYGGAIGLLLAHQMGGRLLSMVLYEPVAFHLLDKHTVGYQEIEQIGVSLVDLSPAERARVFVDYWNHPGFFQSMSVKVQRLFSDKMDKVMLDFKALVGQTYTVDECTLEHCPVLLIEGESSRLSAKTLAKQLAEQLPTVDHQTFAGGHMAPLTQSDEVAQMIAEFLLKSP